MIGPYGLNLIGAGNTTVPELGQLGLLYLMFVAGVELDLALVRVHRRAVIMFGVITFALPMVFGTAIGFALGWIGAGRAAARRADRLPHAARSTRRSATAGLSTDRGVATAVGATVLTDTAALVVLAAVSGHSSRAARPARSRCRSSSAWSVAGRLHAGRAAAAGAARLPLPRHRSGRPLPARDRLLPGRRRHWPRASGSSRSSAPSSPGWR